MTREQAQEIVAAIVANWANDREAQAIAVIMAALEKAESERDTALALADHLTRERAEALQEARRLRADVEALSRAVAGGVVARLLGGA